MHAPTRVAGIIVGATIGRPFVATTATVSFNDVRICYNGTMWASSPTIFGVTE